MSSQKLLRDIIKPSDFDITKHFFGTVESWENENNVRLYISHSLMNEDTWIRVKKEKLSYYPDKAFDEEMLPTNWLIGRIAEYLGSFELHNAWGIVKNANQKT